jgi:transposase
MVKNRAAPALDAWLTDSEQSGIYSLLTFALGLRQDMAAIRAALETAWSNGQTEGQVTRLKLIKRQMYGRAKFDLLRLRVIHPP